MPCFDPRDRDIYDSAPELRIKVQELTRVACSLARALELGTPPSKEATSWVEDHKCLDEKMGRPWK